jgi:hypothetical protein
MISERAYQWGRGKGTNDPESRCATALGSRYCRMAGHTARVKVSGGQRISSDKRCEGGSVEVGRKEVSDTGQKIVRQNDRRSID